MTPEKQVQNEIIAYFKRLSNTYPCYVERRQAGGFSYKMGLPDLWAVIFGKHLEIEVKRPGGQLRATQEKWERKFRDMGAEYVCADCVADVASVVERLQHEYLKGGTV